MPNIDPADLPIVRGGQQPGRPICGSNQCVDITETDGGFLFTSTIEGNEGHVLYTPAETATFLSDVKAGNWDAIHARARVLAEVELTRV